MLTYAEVGATRHAALPPGYQHLRVRARIGTGCFERAAAAILGFEMHRRIPARVRASGRRAAPGVRVTVTIGPLRAPCEVVWAEDGPDRAGFGYGTLPGHPEVGEESFLVERDADGTVWFTVTAFSRPARWYTRPAGPGIVLFQRLYARRLAAVLRGLCARAG